MAYTKHEWVAPHGSNLNRFNKSDETDTSVALVHNPSLENTPTPFSADWMNEMEEGIAAAHEAAVTVVDNVAGGGPEFADCALSARQGYGLNESIKSSNADKVDLGSAQTIYGDKTFNGVTTVKNLTVNSSSTVNMGANKITNVAAPTANTDAATKEYVDNKTPASAVSVVDNLTSSSAASALSANQGRLLNNNKAPNNHASTATTYGEASESYYGHVKFPTSNGGASDLPRAAFPYKHTANQTTINLNNYTNPGVWALWPTSSSTNFPPGWGTAKAALIVLPYYSTAAQQILCKQSSNEIYIRYIGDTWERISSVLDLNGNIRIGQSARGGNCDVAIGHSALSTGNWGRTGWGTVAVGSYAGCIENATANALFSAKSVFIGMDAGKIAASYGNKNRTDCTFVGFAAGQNMDGDRNTIIGKQGTTAVTRSDCVALGEGAAAYFTGNSQIQLGKSGTTVYGYSSYNNRSDRRDKTDIRDTELGLEFIKKLRPVDFRWDIREDYVDRGYDEETGAPYIDKKTPDGSRKGKRFHHGLIAQEVKTVLDELDTDFGGYQDHKVTGGDDVFTIGYTEFVAPLIKAVQELSAQNKALLERIEKLEAAR